jgi:hypothetical protein
MTRRSTAARGLKLAYQLKTSSHWNIVADNPVTGTVYNATVADNIDAQPGDKLNPNHLRIIEQT